MQLTSKVCVCLCLSYSHTHIYTRICIYTYIYTYIPLYVYPFAYPPLFPHPGMDLNQLLWISVFFQQLLFPITLFRALLASAWKKTQASTNKWHHSECSGCISFSAVTASFPAIPACMLPKLGIKHAGYWPKKVLDFVLKFCCYHTQVIARYCTSNKELDLIDCAAHAFLAESDWILLW